MQNYVNKQATISFTGRDIGTLIPCALMLLGCLSSPVSGEGYQQLNLVSDLPGVALLQDTNLVNAWGVSFSSSSPFWISDNGTGKATLYSVTNDSQGATHVSKVALEVNIPGEGNPTGQIFNNLGGFNGDIFIFDSEDGTISGWRGTLGTNAEVLAMRPGAVYKGLALAGTSNAPVLLAANFSEETVDAYTWNGSNTVLHAQYSDMRAPVGYAPFNIQPVSGLLFVTFAKQDADKQDDVAGRGHGLIDVFDPNTGAFHRFVAGLDAGGRLPFINSPWGVALAPATFGRHANQLLVGNFGSGTIMAFDATGRFRGLLQNTEGEPITIHGLWALTFGNGGRAGVPDTLYFTSGPDDESHGLFGSLSPVSENENEQ